MISQLYGVYFCMHHCYVYWFWHIMSIPRSEVINIVSDRCDDWCTSVYFCTLKRHFAKVYCMKMEIVYCHITWILWDLPPTCIWRACKVNILTLCSVVEWIGMKVSDVKIVKSYINKWCQYFVNWINFIIFSFKYRVVHKTWNLYVLCRSSRRFQKRLASILAVKGGHVEQLSFLCFAP